MAKATVTMTGGVVTMALAGGITNAGNATENKVFINDGKAGAVVGGSTGASGNATLNEVTISGGEVDSVRAGLADGDATGNTVTLISGKVLDSMWGGLSTDCTAHDCVTGNTLAVQGKDFPVGGDVSSFDTLNFTLPADIKANDTMLSVDRVAYFGVAPLNDATVSIAVAGMPALAVGDHITLIDANATLGSYTLEISPTSTPDTAKYFWVAKTGDDLYAELTAPLVPVKVAGSTTEGGEVTCAHPEVAQDIGTTTCTATAKAGYTFDAGSMTAGSGTLTEPDGSACKNSECRLSGVTGDVTVSATFTKAPTPPTPDPTPTPWPYYYSGDNSSPSLGELGLLLSGIALAGAAAPALRRREKQGKKADTHQ